MLVLDKHEISESGNRFHEACAFDECITWVCLEFLENSVQEKSKWEGMVKAVYGMTEWQLHDDWHQNIIITSVMLEL